MIFVGMITWTSWHVQNETSLYELQKLGGWSSLDMINRYAYLNSDYLKKAADHLVTGTNLGHEQKLRLFKLAECS
jgi:hypothetical protein